jgi:hypothetical protein
LPIETENGADFLALPGYDNPKFSPSEHGLKAIALVRGWLLDPYKEDDHWLKILQFLGKRILEDRPSDAELGKLYDAVLSLYEELRAIPLLRSRAEKLGQAIDRYLPH